MPTISAFYGIVIQMYFRDHLPPHFHVKYNGRHATFDINKLTLMGGSLPSKELRLVLQWAKLHQHELLENWRLCESMQMLHVVQPLR